MQRAYAAFGVRLLSVDYGPSDDADVWHYQGDAHEIVYSRRWPILIAHPTCKQCRSQRPEGVAAEDRGR
eukprot:255864-Prymnesium_polylepis.1